MYINTIRRSSRLHTLLNITYSTLYIYIHSSFRAHCKIHPVCSPAYFIFLSVRLRALISVSHQYRPAMTFAGSDLVAHTTSQHVYLYQRGWHTADNSVMVSAALEKSLDEIIGDRPSTGRRGSGRPSRGSRPTPYRRDSRSGRHGRDDYRPRRDDRDSDDARWAHDRYDRRRSYQDADSRDDRSYRGQRDGRDSRSTRLRVSNIHYDLSETEVRELFERIAPVARFSMQFDRAGR